MNIETQINGKNVKITLTQEQLLEIKRQTLTISYYTDIDSYYSACKVLSKSPRIENDFDNIYDWTRHQIKVICSAINYLIDDNRNFPNWTNLNENKYYPYFKVSSLCGMVFYFSIYDICSFDGRVGFLKTKEASDHVGKTFLPLYEILTKEKF